MKFGKSVSVVLLLGMAQVASAANLVTNPDFDTDVAGWTGNPVASFSQRTGDGWPAPSAQIGGGGTATSNCIQIGTAQNVDFSIAGLSISPVNKYAVVNTFSDGTCTTFLSAVAAMGLQSNVWKVFSKANFALPAGTQSVQIEVGVATGGNVFFDHVLFGPTGTAPVGLRSFEVQ